MMITTLAGRIIRTHRHGHRFGKIHKGQKIVIKADGSQVNGEVVNLEVFDKLGRTPADEATAGDIVALTGLPEPEIGDTVACPETPVALERISVDEPTLSMLFTINSSPLAGRDGKFVTSRHLRARLYRELESNVALQVESSPNSDHFQVSGRGLLHLGILIETMRREGYEMSIGKPEVIRKQIDGKWHEPFRGCSPSTPLPTSAPVWNTRAPAAPSLSRCTAATPA